MPTEDALVQDTALALLDIITILLVEDDPVRGVVLLALLKMVTEDRLIRLSFIVLIIVLGIVLE